MINLFVSPNREHGARPHYARAAAYSLTAEGNAHLARWCLPIPKQGANRGRPGARTDDAVALLVSVHQTSIPVTRAATN